MKRPGFLVLTAVFAVLGTAWLREAAADGRLRRQTRRRLRPF